MVSVKSALASRVNRAILVGYISTERKDRAVHATVLDAIPIELDLGTVAKRVHVSLGSALEEDFKHLGCTP